jgi:DNA replication protein DnaC
MNNLDLLEKKPSWFEEFKSCGNCDDYGFILKEGIAVKCNCRKIYLKRVSLRNSMLRAGFITRDTPLDKVESLETYTLSNYSGEDKEHNLEKIHKFIEYFGTKYRSLHLFFSGKPGTQKTTIAKFMVRELLCKGYTANYILANDLIEKIISSYREDGSKEEVIHLLDSNFLVIDEFDEDKIISYASGWQRKNLFPWLKKRLEVVKASTLFISNKKIDDIGDYFEEAIQDLLLREVPDHTMIFTDNYIKSSGGIDISSIWGD